MAKQRLQLQIQYLGVRGSTHECVRAMVTILTSFYPCKEITVLFGPPSQASDDKHSLVSFIVWDWLGKHVTIVPDGFGTHSGTGGWGLALVLELIQFYQVPIKEKWIEDEGQFERINDGFPTTRDLRDLHQSDDWAPSWPYNMRDFGSEIWSAISPDPVETFPYWLVEPELFEYVRNFRNDPDGAVFQAAKQLEVVMREIGGFDPGLVGQQLISEAMGSGGLLTPKGATPDEIQSWTMLFKGAIGAIKNPQSHRSVKLGFTDASEQIITLNLLLRKLKSDFPDKFKRRSTRPQRKSRTVP